MSKIVLNIPHSSTVGVFDNVYGRWPRNQYFYNNHVLSLTDLHTDYLFSTQNEEVRQVIFPLSRFVCDVERLENDPLEKDGMGILYTQCGNFKRGELTESAENDIMAIRRMHFESIDYELDDNGLIIDCHSFSSADNEECDICIGYNDYESYDEHIVRIISDEFKASGYKVNFNKPYSNSITPDLKGKKYKSVMIEVNKKVYMDKRTYRLHEEPKQWMRWFGCLDRIYNRIIEYLNEEESKHIK